ncbi:MAG: alcohol dehydrogenase catalytic domain-containing protein, partial [Trebonia sp.]
EEILVEVRAAGVNFPDLLLTKDMYQYKPELPFVLGGEFAGVVREAPADSEFAPGDRVAGSATVGALAELVSLSARSVYPLPGKVVLVP